MSTQIQAPAATKVKNTFVELQETPPLSPEMRYTYGMPRACSDSKLFENNCQFDGLDECDAMTKNVEYEMQGFSDPDCDTGSEDPRYDPLPCYSHLKEAMASEAGSSIGGASPPPEPASSSPEAVQKAAALQQLVSENARLALENEVLKQRMENELLKKQLQRAVAELPGGENRPPSKESVDTNMREGNGGAPMMMWVPMQQMQQMQQMPYCAMPQMQYCPMPSGMEQQMWCNNGYPAWHQSSEPQHGRQVNGKTSRHVSGEQVTPENVGNRTTVMLRNLPNNYTATMVLQMLDDEGFAGLYDFFYLPMDFTSNACLGYAFVNLLDSSHVVPFWKKFHGYSDWVLPSRKMCSVTWSGPHQGAEAHAERYRNSPLMHESIPADYKPMMFKDGARVPFPPPTKAPRAPRVRNKA